MLVEQHDDALDGAREKISGVYQRAINKGRMTPTERETLLAKRLTLTSDFNAVASVDLVIEAVFEDMALKQDIFARLDAVARPGTVLASNTSYLDINEIAAATQRPADVIGLHFFSPANIMRLLEVVIADATSDQAVATGFALAARLKKVAVRAGVCDGFIGNRLLMVYRRAADYLMEDGASPYAIDAALREFGFAMGPYQVGDLAGLDIGWATRKRKAPSRDPNERYVRIADRLCENGWFGQKTGRGFYRYTEQSPRGEPDPEVLAIIDEERRARGIEPREFSNEDIVNRYVFAMINEGANIVDEKIALRPLDVDVVKLFGYGFPRYRGGPMKYADMLGLDRVVASIQAYAQEDPHYWQLSPLLKRLVEQGDTFESLNAAQAT